MRKLCARICASSALVFRNADHFCRLLKVELAVRCESSGSTKSQTCGFLRRYSGNTKVCQHIKLKECMYVCVYSSTQEMYLCVSPNNDSNYKNGYITFSSMYV
jgi:hypothetical protein